MRVARRLVATAGLGIAMLLGACAPPDAPPRPGAAAAPLEDDRRRVAVDGRAGESRERVEQRLLVRAAEAALDAGASHFVVLARDVDATTIRVGDDGFSEFSYARGLPVGAGFGSSAVSARTVTRYAATAEIRLLPDPAARDEAGAMDAAAVIRSGGADAGPAA